jgi:hypothetical protein
LAASSSKPPMRHGQAMMHIGNQKPWLPDS